MNIVTLLHTLGADVMELLLQVKHKFSVCVCVCMCMCVCVCAALELVTSVLNA